MIIQILPLTSLPRDVAARMQDRKSKQRKAYIPHQLLHSNPVIKRKQHLQVFLPQIRPLTIPILSAYPPLPCVSALHSATTRATHLSRSHIGHRKDASSPHPPTLGKEKTQTQAHFSTISLHMNPSPPPPSPPAPVHLSIGKSKSTKKSKK